MRLEKLEALISRAHAMRGEDLPMEKARDLAWSVLSFFGYSDHCLANALDASENAVFCYIEDLGILKPESKVELLADTTAEWRMVRWTFDFYGISRIEGWEPKEETDALQALYASMPPEAFVAGEQEDLHGEMTVQVIPEEGIAVLNGGSEEMENGKIIAGEVRERLERMGKEIVSQKFMEAVLKDLSGGEKVNGYGTVQELVHQGFLKPNGDDGYLVEKGKSPDVSVEVKGGSPCHICGETMLTQQLLMVHIKKRHPFDVGLLKKLLAEGKTTKEIMDIMHRSDSTVEYHVRRLRDNSTGETGKKDADETGAGTPAEKGKENQLTPSDDEVQSLRTQVNGLKEDLKAAESEIKSLQEKYQYARKEKEMFREDLLKLSEKQKQPEGTLLSNIYIKHFDGYYDGQKKMISSVIHDEITRGGKGKEISVEVWDNPPEKKVILRVREQEEKQ
jgi:hypothetical protein